MDLSSFAFVHWSYYERIKETSNSSETIENIKGTVEKDFREAYETGSIGYSSARKINVNSGQADFAWLRTTYKNIDDDWLWGYNHPNGRNGLPKCKAVGKTR